MASPGKRRIYNAVRIGICLAALWFVIRGVSLTDTVHLARPGETIVGRVIDDGDPIQIRTDAGEIVSIPRAEIAREIDGSQRIQFGLLSAGLRSDVRLLILAVLLHFPVVFPLALRFQRLLRVQGISLGFAECVKLSLAGNFLNFATPLGSNAGDVFKAYFASLHTDRKTEAVTTVLLDRLIGLGTLVLMVGLIAALTPPTSRIGVMRPYMVAAIAVGAVAVLAYLSPLGRRLRIPSTLIARVPALCHVDRMNAAVRSLMGNPGALITAVLLSLVLQGLALSSYFTVAMAVSLKAGLANVLEFFAYFYSGAVVQSLPGPPQGLGTVELAYRYFFVDFGSPSQIVFMAFAIRAVVLVCALPGLVVTLTGSYRPAALRNAVDEASPKHRGADAHHAKPMPNEGRSLSHISVSAVNAQSP